MEIGSIPEVERAQGTRNAENCGKAKRRKDIIDDDDNIISKPTTLKNLGISAGRDTAR